MKSILRFVEIRYELSDTTLIFEASRLGWSYSLIREGDSESIRKEGKFSESG